MVDARIFYLPFPLFCVIYPPEVGGPCGAHLRREMFQCPHSCVCCFPTVVSYVALEMRLQITEGTRDPSRRVAPMCLIIYTEGDELAGRVNTIW